MPVFITHKPKTFGKASGQAMMPILITASAILVGMILASQGLNNNTKAAKTSQTSVDSDLLKVQILQVINSPTSCSEIIAMGDVAPGGAATPITFNPSATGPLPYVFAQNHGLYFPNPTSTSVSVPGTPFLVVGGQSNSMKINVLRLDPTGYMDMKVQSSPRPIVMALPSPAPPSVHCYQLNLHIEPANPTVKIGSNVTSAAYGGEANPIDIPIYVGVNAANKIIACGSQSSQSCISPIPMVFPMPSPSCAGSPLPYITDISTESVRVSGPGISGSIPGPSGSPTSVNIPPPPAGPGPFVYTVTPYAGAGGTGSSGPSITYTITPAPIPSFASVGITQPTPGPQATVSWATYNEGDTVVVSGSGITTTTPYTSNFSLAIPAPTPSSVYTFRPTNVCGSPGPVTTAISP